MSIRPATLADLPALRTVCLLTGDNGADATGRWSDDGLIPDVFLEPYLRYPDALNWVVDEGAGPLGYLIAVPDTTEFAHWWREHWVPEFVERHGLATEREGEGWLFEGGTRPERMVDAAPEGYPAHLHIDLLPAAQGRGHGRELMRTLGSALAERGAGGVHLGVGAANVGALAFYRRLGFSERGGADGFLMTLSTERLAAL